MESKLVVKIEKMFKLPDAGSLCAFFDFEINDVLVIRGCRIVRGKKGLFITMPKEQGKDSKWYDQVVCKNAEIFEEISRVALEHFESMK